MKVQEVLGIGTMSDIYIPWWSCVVNNLCIVSDSVVDTNGN